MQLEYSFIVQGVALEQVFPLLLQESLGEDFILPFCFPRFGDGAFITLKIQLYSEFLLEPGDSVLTFDVRFACERAFFGTALIGQIRVVLLERDVISLLVFVHRGNDYKKLKSSGLLSNE